MSFISPPQHEEINPYRPAWRSIIIESLSVAGIAVAFFVLYAILHVNFPVSLRPIISVAIAISPALAWIVFSLFAEGRIAEPRQRLFLVALIAALSATAIAQPLATYFFQVDQWLPLAPAIRRILGYTFTVGISQELLKYLVLRYLVWGQNYRTREDSVAYSAACAVGFSTALTLAFVLAYRPPPDVAALRMLANYAANIAPSMIVSYALAEMRFGAPGYLTPAILLIVAALIVGIAIPIRAGLVNSTLNLAISAPKPIFGLGFSLVLLVAPPYVLRFLFENAERRDQEARGKREV